MAFEMTILFFQLTAVDYFNVQNIKSIRNSDPISIHFIAETLMLSRKNWFSVGISMIETEVRNSMASERYDQVPVVERDEVTGCWETIVNGRYNRIKRKGISDFKYLNANDSFSYIVNKFANDKKSTYYFVMNSEVIIGILPLSNLNSRVFKVFLYYHLCELEENLQDFISSKIDTQKIIAWLEEKRDSGDKESWNILVSYKRVQKQNVENSILTHFYLPLLLELMSDFKLNEQLTTSAEELNKLKSIKTLRNNVAHPVKAIINEKYSVSQLNADLITIIRFNQLINS